MGLLIAAFVVQGCATVGPPHEITKRDVLSRAVIPHRASSNVVLGWKHLEGDAVLTVGLNEDWQCFDSVREVVRIRTYNKADADGLGLSVAGTIVAVAAGVILLGISPSLSTMKGTSSDGEEMASPRDEAITFGVLALAGAVALGANTIRVATAAQPHLIRTDETNRDTRAERGHYPCGSDPVVRGTAVAIVNGHNVDLRTSPAGRRLRIDLRSALEEMCASDLSPNDKAKVVFRTADQTEIPLAIVPLANCVNAGRARRHVDEASRMARQQNGSSLLRAIDEAEQAQRLLRTLPDGDPARSDLRSDLRATQQNIEAAISQLDAADTGSLFSKTKPTGDDLLREGSAALSLAPKRKEPGRAWQNAMQSIEERVSPGARGYLEMVAMIRRAGQEDCLINGWQCPDWLTTEAINGGTQRLSVDFAHSSATYSKSIAAASRALSRSTNLKNGLAAEAVLSAAAEWMEACDSDNQLQVPSIRTACVDLLAAAGEARKILAAKTETIASLKEVATKREHDAHERKGLQEWRSQFARCRRLASALPDAERLNASGRCVGECKDALSKMKKDSERIEQFRGDMSLDPSTMETVRNECQEANCPNCP